MIYSKQAIRDGNFVHQTLFVTQHKTGFSTVYHGRILGVDPSRQNAIVRSLAFLSKRNEHPKQVMISNIHGKVEVKDV